MKKLLLFAFIISNSIVGIAQNVATISGTTIDNTSKKALPYVSAELTNTANKTIGGTISNDNGLFIFENIPQGDYSVHLSYIGYSPTSKKIHIGELNSNYDLGKIILSPISIELDGVEISSEKATISSGLQKKSFTLDKNIAQAGGSVLKAIQNMPGVTVSPDGIVSLRGSENVLVLIDGKQSSLTGFGTHSSLDNIPASNVESIEIINNPSAKYDAKGNAGIINIIYKKDQEVGFNGEIGLSAGVGELTHQPTNLEGINIQRKYAFTPKLSPNLSLNYRSDKINYFIQSDAMVRRKINSNIFTNRYYDDGRITNQQFSEMREQMQYDIKFGIDWFASDNDKITIFGLWEDEYHTDNGDVPYIYNNALKQNRLWEWTEDEDTKFINLSALYNHIFAQPGHTLDLAYSFTGGREDELFPFSDKYFDADAKQVGNSKFDSTHLFVWEFVHNITLDYVKPLPTGRLETGLFANLRSIPVDYYIYSGTPPTGYMDTQLGEWSEYTENVFAAYGNYVYENKTIEAEIGLRLEESLIDYRIDDANIYYNAKNKNNYFDWYPNMRLSYNLTDNNKLSLFYNKRVDRPNEFQLRPFPKYDDPEVLRTGNPALKPQFTQNAELAYKLSWDNGSFYGAAYYKWINDIIARTAISDPILTDVVNYVPANLGQGTNAGFEIVFEQALYEWLNFDFNFNWYQNSINAFSGYTYYPDPNGIAFTFDEETNNTWNLKANANISLENGLEAQMSFIYFAPDIVPQAELSSHYALNLGISKSIFEDKGEIYINATDLFNTNKIKQTIKGEDFKMIRKDYLETQVVMLGFKYKF